MTLSEDLGTGAMLPREMVIQYGVVRWLHAIPGFHSFMVDANALRLFQGATSVFLLLGVIGLWTRGVIPMAALCYLILGGVLRQYGIFFHTGIIPFYVLCVLSFTPCGDGRSIDSVLRKARGNSPQKAAVYGWARYACWVAIAFPYFAAGVSKVINAGPFWWTATNMKAMLYRCTLEPLNSGWTASLRLGEVLPDWAFSMLGLLALISELAFCAVLFSRTARVILPVVMMLIQVGIFFLQNILFIDLVLLMVFLEDAGLRRTVSRLAFWRSARKDPSKIPPADIQPAPDTPVFGWSPIGVAGLAALFATVVILRIEFYPLTAMQMFSQKEPVGQVDYCKVIVHREAGRAARVSLTDVLGAEADFRYRPHLRSAFSSRATIATGKYLAVCASNMNQRLPSGNKVTYIELQRWRWDFISEPHRPPYGQIIDRRFYNAATGQQVDQSEVELFAATIHTSMDGGKDVANR